MRKGNIMLRKSTKRQVKQFFFRTLSCAIISSMMLSFSLPGVAANSGEKFEQIGTRISEIPQVLRNALSEKITADTVVLESDDLYSITTKNPDGTGDIDVFTLPIKYEDQNGEIQYIDTGMVAKPVLRSLFGDYTLQNAANSFTAEFSLKAEKGFRMNDEFTFSVYNENGLPKGSVMTTKEGSGKIVYPEAFGPNTYVEYINTSKGVKENIILQENIGENRFSFRYTSSSHDLLIDEELNAVLVVRKDDPSVIDYIFNPVYVYDSYKQQTDTEKLEGDVIRQPGEFRHFVEGTYELAKIDEHETIVTLIVPNEYLNHPDVVYPVTIDPNTTTVDVDNSAVIVDDTFIKESAPTSNYYLLDYLQFGNNNGKIYSYVRFPNLPSLPFGAKLTDSVFTLTFRSGQTTGGVGACCRVTSYVEGKNMTWNNHPTDSTPRVTSSHNNFTKYEFHVGPTVVQWCNGTAPNYGFRFGYNNENLDDYNSVVSSDGEYWRAPKLNITYQTPEVTGISLSANNVTLGVGDEYALKATFTPSNPANKVVYWSSSDDSVAFVDSNGVIHAYKRGVVTVTAQSKDNLKAIATCKVTVTYCGNNNYRDGTKHDLVYKTAYRMVCTKCGYELLSPGYQDESILSEEDYLIVETCAVALAQLNLRKEKNQMNEREIHMPSYIYKKIDDIRSKSQYKGKYAYSDLNGNYIREFKKYYPTTSQVGSCSLRFDAFVEDITLLNIGFYNGALTNLMYSIASGAFKGNYSHIFAAAGLSGVEAYPGAFLSSLTDMIKDKELGRALNAIICLIDFGSSVNDSHAIGDKAVNLILYAGIEQFEFKGFYTPSNQFKSSTYYIHR